MRSVNKGKEVIMTNKEFLNIQKEIKSLSVDNATILALITLHDQFDFTEDQLTTFLHRYITKAECISGDYTTWDDQLKILADEAGIDLIFDKNKGISLKIRDE